MIFRGLILILFCLSLHLSTEAASPVTVAILDFEQGEGIPAETGRNAAALLNGLLSAQGDLHLVERDTLDNILSETELTLSGAVSEDTAAKIGQLTGARILVTGRIFTSGKTNYVVTKIISAENGRVFGLTEKFLESEDIGGPVEVLAEKTASLISEKSGDLLVTTESPVERIARLKKVVEGKELPSVFVEIPEEHLSRTVPDPAAQTEIQKTLQDVGFVLVKDSIGADIVITGEAFSELAGRRANLISCRARVEIQIDESDNDQIFVDRQTSVAIDLAENVAAKSALQEAGARLADRLVVTLAE